MEDSQMNKYEREDVITKLQEMQNGQRNLMGLSFTELESVLKLAKVGNSVLNRKAEKNILLIDEDGNTEVYESRGKVSDKYHDFNELYECRHILFAALINQVPDSSWKSKLHHDGTMYDNYFIAGIETAEGQYTFHIPMEHFDMFKCVEVEKAPEWDGHTTGDIKRLLNIFESYRIG